MLWKSPPSLCIPLVNEKVAFRVSIHRLNSPKSLLARILRITVFVAASPSATLKFLVRQRVLLGFITPNGPICSLMSLNGPFSTHPAPLIPNSPAIAPNNPSRRPLGGVFVVFLLTPLPPNPLSGSKIGDFNQEPLNEGVSRDQSQSNQCVRSCCIWIFEIVTHKAVPYPIRIHPVAYSPKPAKHIYAMA